MDGTLIDSTDAIVLSFLDVFEKFDLQKPTPKKIKKYIGYTLEDMFLNMQVEKKYINECVKEYKSFYRQRALDTTTFLPGAKEAVEKAFAFANLGIVTTKTGKYSKEILEHLGIMEYFDVLIGREDVTYPKPHKEPIQKALSLMPYIQKNIWMIGDTRFDLLSAKNAGINAIGVLSGYGSKDELVKYTSFIEEDAFLAVTFLEQF